MGAESKRLDPIDPRAVALSAFRGLPDGGSRQYTATTFPRDPWQGCERMTRMGWYVGYLKPSCVGECRCYAVLDVQDDEGDIVQDFCIPTAKAFRWWYRQMHWRVEQIPEGAVR
jgi:hypothetical protein